MARTGDGPDNDYAIITPVKDEGAYLPYTIESVLNQTVRPVRWIIVDDNSSDDTADIVRSYSGTHDWIQLVQTHDNPRRATGSAEIVAFNAGYRELLGSDCQFIVKLDGDLEFEGHYFEKLLTEFHGNERLGIASGRYLETVDGCWKPVRMPDYHAAGASKMVRRGCFEQIGGFLPARGWDTVDEIKAWARGWETAHFKDICFYHLKPEGSGMGYAKTCRMHGEIYYLSGGGTLFFALKVLHRCLAGRPFMVGGMMMLAGYVAARMSHADRLVTEEEADLYRSLLNSRLFGRLHRPKRYRQHGQLETHDGRQSSGN